MKTIPLTPFELDVLAAVLSQQPNPTAELIAKQAVSQSRDGAGLSAVYAILDKLERKGMVAKVVELSADIRRTSWAYAVTGEGRLAFKRSLTAQLADVSSPRRNERFGKWRRYAAMVSPT